MTDWLPNLAWIALVVIVVLAVAPACLASRSEAKRRENIHAAQAEEDRRARLAIPWPQGPGDRKD